MHRGQNFSSECERVNVGTRPGGTQKSSSVLVGLFLSLTGWTALSPLKTSSGDSISTWNREGSSSTQTLPIKTWIFSAVGSFLEEKVQPFS